MYDLWCQNWKTLRFALASLIFVPSIAFAALPTPLRSSSGLDRPRLEQVIRVSTAQIALMDRALIETDFPQLKGKTDHELKEFLLNQAGFISLPQASQTETNSAVSVDAATLRNALRPEYYGRSLVYQIPNGMFDVKGAGSIDPQPHNAEKFHRNGLFSLGEAIREYVLDREINKVLEHSGSATRTVGSYAVISWGFDLKDRGITLPAGAIIRQSHTRYPKASTYRPELGSRNHFLPKEDSELIERILRAYGYSTEHESDETPRWLIDVQGTKDKNLVDFGTYHSRDHFFQTSFWYPERKFDAATPIFTRDTTPQPVRELLPAWEVRNFINLPTTAKQLADNFRQGAINFEQLQNWTARLLKSGTLPESLRGTVCAQVLKTMAPAMQLEGVAP